MSFSQGLSKKALPRTPSHTLKPSTGDTSKLSFRANDLAGRIHSEADASALPSEIVFLFPKELDPGWANAGELHRLSDAGYASAVNPARVIPE